MSISLINCPEVILTKAFQQILDPHWKLAMKMVCQKWYSLLWPCRTSWICNDSLNCSFHKVFDQNGLKFVNDQTGQPYSQTAISLRLALKCLEKFSPLKSIKLNFTQSLRAFAQEFCDSLFEIDHLNGQLQRLDMGNDRFGSHAQFLMKTNAKTLKSVSGWRPDGNRSKESGIYDLVKNCPNVYSMQITQVIYPNGRAHVIDLVDLFSSLSDRLQQLDLRLENNCQPTFSARYRSHLILILNQFQSLLPDCEIHLCLSNTEFESVHQIDGIANHWKRLGSLHRIVCLEFELADRREFVTIDDLDQQLALVTKCENLRILNLYIHTSGPRNLNQYLITLLNLSSPIRSINNRLNSITISICIKHWSPEHKEHMPRFVNNLQEELTEISMIVGCSTEEEIRSNSTFKMNAISDQINCTIVFYKQFYDGYTEAKHWNKHNLQLSMHHN